MKAFYNEIDRFCCDWLSNLMDAGQIMPGKIDDRSIVDVRPDDLAGFERVHFFAGIGGWDYSLRLAGWPAGRPVWTGSCPCQPFSLAGAQRGFGDDRHLWPEFRRLIAECSPPVIFGEQVASATEWLGLVRSDLEALGYAVGAIPIQAASAGADHLRDRYWFVADADHAGSQGRQLLRERSSERPAGSNGLVDTESIFVNRSGSEPPAGLSKPSVSCSLDDMADGEVDTDTWQRLREEPRREHHTNAERRDGGSELSWVVGADGKSRRVKSGVRLLAHGIPNRVGLLRGFGNAIDPRPAAAFIAATIEASDLTRVEPSESGR